MIAALIALALAAPPPPTAVLDGMGKIRPCEAAPGLAGWLLSERKVWSLDKVLKRKAPPLRGVVVSFFATWCEPCKAGLPRLERASAALREQGVETVLVAVRSEQGVGVAPFLKGLGVTLPTVRDKFGAIWEAWAAPPPGGDKPALPRTVILDDAGRLVAALGREGPDYEEKLASIVAELPRKCRSKVLRVLH